MRIISVPIGNGRAPAIGEGHRNAAEVCAHERSSHVSGDGGSLSARTVALEILIELVRGDVGIAESCGQETATGLGRGSVTAPSRGQLDAVVARSVRRCGSSAVGESDRHPR